ncbi:hypothetical protein F5Y17DRAFT_477272 [Xylariaceae sp. FL0594]|nr:hypothetical protein F5Y17DRAFT_477272 [Xylariaceae sp. FL0594]
MQLPRSVLPSQRYSPASDYTYDENNHHEAVSATRQPLNESTGNIQPQGLTTALWCNQSSLSPPIHSIPTPILPTQTLASSYGTSLRGEGHFYRNVHFHDLAMGGQRGRRNPIYQHKNFADYRNKVMQKELDKEQTVWPDWLEDAFLDALLLIPQMGRKKFSSKTILYGRNMLISEYLWIYHWTLHQPKKGEIIPSGKQREKTRTNHGHPMFRSRKQVSSHIQVLKGFFPTLSTFHFIFPTQKDGSDDDRRFSREEDDTESFKHNRVLISVVDGRLPDERPNYEYFSRLLNAENDVFIRPKQCWIFVSSPKVAIKERHTTAKDGTVKKQITGHHPDGLTLTETDYPHLKLNDSKDYKDLPRQGNNPTVLLHEYTRSLSQKESSSVREISSRWDARFPELRDKLTAALDATQPSDERTSRCVVGPCDTFHFETVLDLHATSKFPSGSDLNGLVEFTICRPGLHNHAWRSKTSVIKPDELYMTEGEDDYWDQGSSIDVISAHRVGCTGASRCDCISRGSRDTISIPFPANSWANTFIKLAPYVTEEREREERERARREAASPDGRAEREAARVRKASEEGLPPKSEKASPMDLLAQVAMYQEIWSAPQIIEGRTHGGDASAKRTRGAWTRRAVILWTFVPVHEKTDANGKTTIVSPGTSWRFLTKVDPTSSYHQQQAYVSGGAVNALSRDDVMSPNPGYAHHVNAAMHENFGGAFTVAGHPQFRSPGHLQSLHQQQHLTGLDTVLDGYPHGLHTPPPTATLPSNYSPTFEGNGTDIEPTHTLHRHLSFISDGSTSTATTDHTHATEVFLSGLDEAFDDLPTHYINTTHPGTDNPTTISWDEAGCLSAATTSESQWAMLAAAATTAAGHGATQQQAIAHETSHVSLSPGIEHQDFSTWGTWQVATDLGRGASPTSIWDEGAGVDVVAQEGETEGSPTAMTPIRNHTTTMSLAQGTQSVAHAPPHHPQRHPLLASHHSPTMLAGRKRSRTESAGPDVEDEDDEYPAHSMRKFAHPRAAVTPTAPYGAVTTTTVSAGTSTIDSPSCESDTMTPNPKEEEEEYF